MTYSAIILLGGNATRFGSDINKVYKLINNKAICAYSLDLFLSDCDCNEVIVVYNPKDKDILNELLINYPSVFKTIGGNKRSKSVLEGLKIATNDIVFVHDGARPNININDIKALKDAIKDCDAVALGVPVTDTIKRQSAEKVETVSRDNLYAIQTPQVSNRNLLLSALTEINDDIDITDDLMALERYHNCKCKIVLGSKTNIKVTTEEDYQYLKYLMGDRNV